MRLTLYRRLSQIAFLVFIGLIPVFNLLRYDTDTHQLYLLGIEWTLGLKEGFYADTSASGALNVALHFFFKAILPWLVVLAIFPLLGVLLGRFFCGWLCPEGTLFELADFLTHRLLGRRSLYSSSPHDPEPVKGSRIPYILLTAVSLIVTPVAGGIALTGFLVNPATIWSQLASGHLTFGVKAGIIGVATYMVITSVFVRHSLCRFVCAAGLMQMLFGWISPVSLRIGMDSGRAQDCTNCRKCEKACFMHVNPRRNRRDISCVNCGACIDACNRELGSRRGLFHYRSGETCAGPDRNCGQIPDAQRLS